MFQPLILPHSRPSPDRNEVYNPQPTPISCTNTNKPLRRVWQDYTLPNGRLISNGFGLSSEDQWYVYFGDDDTLTGFDFAYETSWLYNLTSDYPWEDFTDSVSLDSERVNPGAATADKYDISPYINRPGKKPGKIIMYNGLADGVISPKSTQLYYNRTISAMGTNLGDIRSWFRYFEVPGMQHCFFSNRFNAPWDFAAPGQASILRVLPVIAPGLPAFGDGWSVPGHLNDSNYDILAALVKWVEEDKPVDKVIATVSFVSVCFVHGMVMKNLREIAVLPHSPSSRGPYSAVGERRKTIC